MPENPPDPTEEFVALLTRNQPDLLVYLRGLMPGHPEVQDVLQKANIVLWKKRGEFAPGTNFRAWAFTVARYEALAHLKTCKRSKVFSFDPDLFGLMADEGVAEMDDAHHRLEALEICLGKLRHEDHELVKHRYCSRGGLEAYARNCGRSVSSLSVRLFRIREALRRCVALQLEGGKS